MTSTTAPRARPLVRVLVAVVLALGGVALAGVGLAGVHQARDEASWPAVEAEVVRVEQGRYQYQSEGARPGTRTGTRIVVIYRYTVDGRPYTSSRYSTDEAHDDFGQGQEAEAAQRFAELERATRISAYVPPDDPARAVLTPAELAPALVASVLGGVVLLGALLLAASARGGRPRP